ncbi:putative hydrolase [Glonium stellatum]|uniref:Putative hydrolase n=1 Tax=Glonium stellatum TaxID=574774 RepID=A0A8E2F550_9PEZI|nr:putative hydrolase [Glonium stellatum]
MFVIQRYPLIILQVLVVLHYHLPWINASAIPSSRSPKGKQDIAIQNENVTIHYNKYGSGPVIVFQHGFPDKATTWNTFQVDKFADSYTVITPFLRGYPPSGVPDAEEEYTKEKCVSDLLAILDHERTQSATIIGHDVGGAVAQYFAAAHPERVHALIMVNTPVLPVFEYLIEFDKDQQKMAEYTIQYEAYQLGQPKNISSIVKFILNATYRHEIAEYLEQSPIDGMLHFYNENYPGPPYGKNLSTVGLVQNVPSMILWGENDPYFSPKMIDGLQPWFLKGIRLVTVPDAGHWVFRDSPEKVNAEIESFLGLLRKYNTKR